MVRNRNFSSAVACVGAVIGAGFASGREIVAFFTRYGVHSWWLILLSAAVMVGLCVLLQRAAEKGASGCWCELYRERPRWIRYGAQACAVLLMAVTGGAMVSASGHMVALLWPGQWAYPIGAVGTLIAAWVLGFASLRPLSWLSGALTALFLAASMAVLSRDVPVVYARLSQPVMAGDLVWAGVRAVAYAAMNLTLAIGVVCRCSRRSSRSICRMSLSFGLTLVAMLFVSNYLYLKHPELLSEAFPIVRLMSMFGRTGFVMSVSMLYLAIFTTLAAVIYALRNAVEKRVHGTTMRALATMGLPLLVSLIGFEGIVDGLYAPAGLMCLAMVFAPLALKKRKSPEK